jgi:hypothetical protein
LASEAAKASADMLRESTAIFEGVIRESRRATGKVATGRNTVNV